MIAEDDSEDDDEEEDMSDHEYHTEENTVGKRIKPYRQVSVQEESSKQIVETFSKNEIAAQNNSKHIKEIEEIFHDSISHNSKIQIS